MKLKHKSLSVPIIQGGMGVGVSMANLAGHVAKCGGMGVISSANAGYLEPDFETNPKEANLRGLQKCIRRAKEIAEGKGLVAVNIMTAVSNYENTCRAAIEAGADAIISGAGLPLKLPEIIREQVDNLAKQGLAESARCLFAPIVSGGKAAMLLCKNYLKKYNMLPDFLVVEGSKAGGHLGFSPEELLNDTAKDNDTILEEVLEAVKPFEEQQGEKIPVFVAGGVYDGADMAHFMEKGASGVQLATRFIATHECDAHENFKQAMIDAKKEDIIIVESPVGMPARAINSPLLQRLKNGGKFPPKLCNGCLTACKKGDLTPYCISRALIAAVNGDMENGLFFCGENAWRINEILSVEELMNSIRKEAEKRLGYCFA